MLKIIVYKQFTGFVYFWLEKEQFIFFFVGELRELETG